MKKMAMRAVLLAAIFQTSTMAFAGFVDDTVAPAVPAAAAPKPAAILRLTADYHSPLWDKPIAPQTSPVPLAKAVAMLLPPDLPGIVVAADPAMDSLVSWDTGLTRREALQRVVPGGMALSLEAGKAVLFRKPPTLSQSDLSAQLQARIAGAAAAGGASAQPAPVAQAPVLPKFVANVADKTVRQVIARWVRGSGWSFDDSYWDIPRDVPVVGTAVFTSDLKESVLALLKTTEVTDLPAKPCFYTNKVIRVVNKAEKCDKTKE